MAIAVSAGGNSVPPFFVFQLIVHYKEHFIRDGPQGCMGSANPSGWMKEEYSILFMKHFVNNVKCIKDRPVLLLLDNYESHLSIPALDFAKENGVIMLSFPPHCSYMLQPLDRSVFGPLKKFVNYSCAPWMKNHPCSTISIYDIHGIVASSLPHAITPVTIIEKNSASSSNQEAIGVTFLKATIPEVDALKAIEPKTPVSETTASCSTFATTVLSPEDIRPFSKASERKKKKNGGRKKGKSAILTDTPIKDEIAASK
ncbi:uncharacterized protein LOC125503809 [Dendroctonus ponderosae]|uniref:uncharacterized protein LOC125503809 n=1 Tax=Dendroctonus ponderosae TaxID=77166 RepID=UPI002035B9E3|nr:uncharacterized protein LOC125503809 [Dendroctonus ponderosae]